MAAALALLALGSFVDYPLSCALYNETNPFAMFFAAYGEIPATLGWVAAGTLFVCGRNRDNKIRGAIQGVCGILLILLYIFIRVPFTTTYLLNFFASLSRSYEEAAAIDGCTPGKTFWKIMLTNILFTILLIQIRKGNNSISQLT